MFRDAVKRMRDDKIGIVNVFEYVFNNNTQLQTSFGKFSKSNQTFASDNHFILARAGVGRRLEIDTIPGNASFVTAIEHTLNQKS